MLDSRFYSFILHTQNNLMSTEEKMVQNYF